ncbi:MAG: hypothetical protein ACI4KG_03120, partial [Oscillospiraceae bacterium]
LSERFSGAPTGRKQEFRRVRAATKGSAFGNRSLERLANFFESLRCLLHKDSALNSCLFQINVTKPQK